MYLYPCMPTSTYIILTLSTKPMYRKASGNNSLFPPSQPSYTSSPTPIPSSQLGSPQFLKPDSLAFSLHSHPSTAGHLPTPAATESRPVNLLSVGKSPPCSVPMATSLTQPPPSHTRVSRTSFASVSWLLSFALP